MQQPNDSQNMQAYANKQTSTQTQENTHNHQDPKRATTQNNQTNRNEEQAKSSPKKRTPTTKLQKRTPKNTQNTHNEHHNTPKIITKNEHPNHSKYEAVDIATYSRFGLNGSGLGAVFVSYTACVKSFSRTSGKQASNEHPKTNPLNTPKQTPETNTPFTVSGKLTWGNSHPLPAAAAVAQGPRPAPRTSECRQTSG